VELEEDGIVVVASPTFPKSYNLPALGLSSLKHTIKAVFGILRSILNPQKYYRFAFIFLSQALVLER
jgi:hypothetical protein